MTFCTCALRVNNYIYCCTTKIECEVKGSWGGEWGLRRVRRDRRATSSKDSLWPYSVGMLRPSWGVPPAQVDFSLTVCVTILTQ